MKGPALAGPRPRSRRRHGFATQARLDLEPRACAAPVAAREERPRPSAAPAGLGAGGGRSTLGDAVAGVWEGLLAAGSAPCPVCGGTMRRDGHAGSCESCGSSVA